MGKGDQFKLFPKSRKTPSQKSSLTRPRRILNCCCLGIADRHKMDQGWLEVLFFNYNQLSLDQRRQVVWVTEAASQVHHQYPSPEEREEKMKLFLDLNPQMATTAAELFHGTSLLPSSTGGPSDSGLPTNSTFFN